MEGKLISSECGAVYYWVYPNVNPNAPCIVFTHGLTVNHHVFDRQISYFTQRYTVLTWDLPMHGRSRPYHGFTYEDAARQLWAILERERIDRAILVGQAIGGAVCQKFAALYPDQVMALVCISSMPLGDVRFEPHEWDEKARPLERWMPYRRLVSSMANSLAQTNYGRHQARDMLKELSKREILDITAAAYADTFRQKTPLKLPCPLLLIAGREDGDMPHQTQRWAQLVRCSVHTISGGQHCNVDAPDSFNECVEAFIQKHCTTEKKNVLVLVPCRQSDLEQFRTLERSYQFLFTDTPTPKQLEQAAIIIGQPTDEQLEHAKRLEWVQLSFAGADKFTSNAKFPRNVLLTNTSGAFGRSISEYVLAMIFSLQKRLYEYRDQQHAHLWRDCGAEDTLFGKTVLLIGAGNIGTCTAELTEKFHCRNIGVSRTKREAAEPFEEMHRMADLPELLPLADVVVCALPLTAETRNCIGAEQFACMKPEALFLNVGRGATVDTDALVRALQSHQIRGAAVDVVEPEPLPNDHALWGCANAIVTPHITGMSYHHLSSTTDAIMELYVENLRRYAARHSLKNLVSFQTGY